jgi:polyketide cyclase/dehydrase/lipid transport protein
VNTPLTYADSIVIARSPADLYDMVSDVTRMGEWSPVCKACWWDDGLGPSAGAWFTGTLVTESWEMPPAGLKRFDERFRPDAAAQVANRFEEPYDPLSSTGLRGRGIGARWAARRGRSVRRDAGPRTVSRPAPERTTQPQSASG